MWPLCASSNILWLLLPLLLGVLTGWWAWHRRGSIFAAAPARARPDAARDAEMLADASAPDRAPEWDGSMDAAAPESGRAALGAAAAPVVSAAPHDEYRPQPVAEQTDASMPSAAPEWSESEPGSGDLPETADRNIGHDAADITGEAAPIADRVPEPLTRGEEIDEPVAVAPIDSTLHAPTPAFALSDPSKPDDLTRLRGVGPALASTLNLLGITRFAQIAAWTPEEKAHVDQKLGSFSGRIDREEWIEQAKLLAAGDANSFASRFGDR